MQRQLLLSQFASQAWAMDPTYLATFASVLQRWSSGEPASNQAMSDIHAAQNARVTKKQSSTNTGNISVLFFNGVVSQKANLVQEASGSGGLSTQVFTGAFRDALDDPSIGGLLIDFDSPGGSVYGTGELATEIYNARGKKPIYGYVNSLCASAAYWVAAQCDQLFITPGGQAGSLGVYMQHIDESGALDKAGLKVEFISAGKYKVEGNSLGPLQSQARSHLQNQIDSYYSAFTSAVAKGRGVPVASVRGGFGEGRCLTAGDALKAGMVDGVCSFEEVIARLSQCIKGGSANRTSTASVKQSVTSGHTVAMNARRRELEIAEMSLHIKTENQSQKRKRINEEARQRELALLSIR